MVKILKRTTIHNANILSSFPLHQQLDLDHLFPLQRSVHHSVTEIQLKSDAHEIRCMNYATYPRDGLIWTTFNPVNVIRWVALN
jgi:hypothetical protein